MTADLQEQGYVNEVVLYMALELSTTKWRLAFGDGTRQRQVVIAAGDVASLREELAKRKGKWGLCPDSAVVSVYEAGRDGFWLHRDLVGLGIANQVVDTASIEVSRRAGGVACGAVPDVESEDLRQLHREREDLLSERPRHRNRLGSKLVAQGIRLPLGKDVVERLDEVKLFDGSGLPAHLKAGLIREWERRQVVQAQLWAIEQAIKALIEGTDRAQAVRSLMLLTGVGWVGAWVLVMELFGWRELTNRRQLASLAGLVPSPYSSGNLARDQGISKAGNRRVQALMIQLAWLWLRYQPDSKHSRVVVDI